MHCLHGNKPLQMVGSIWLEGIVSQKSQSDERAAMESATSIATEAVVSIKTVQSLGNHYLSLLDTKYVLACLNIEYVWYVTDVRFIIWLL